MTGEAIQEREIMVETSSGRLQGTVSKGVAIFKGIPYATARRFQVPLPVAPWAGVRDATDYGRRALQDDGASSFGPEMRALLGERDSRPSSEDSLYLNVWTPSTQGGKRPVLFWMHGGAFMSGSGGEPWSDGTNLAANDDVVVVTVNHRLGAAGFLYLAELAPGHETHKYETSGINGMLDLVQALHWVRDNIASFGGDPANVTIFGESGGGAKACVLMAMPAAKGLFHKAVIQSGPAVEMMPKDAATAVARQVLEHLGTDAAGAAAVPAAKLIEAQKAVMKQINPLAFAKRRRQGFNPVLDGKYLPGGPFSPVAPAISADIPVMIGTNKDEMLFMFGHAPWFTSMNEAGLVERVKTMCEDDAERVLAAYRAIRPNDSVQDIFIAIATDHGMRIPSFQIADRKVAQGAAPVYDYFFTWETPVLGGKLKAPHTLEIPFVFDNVDQVGLTGTGADRYPLASRMSRAWVAFARTGNPNHPGLPQWPAYESKTRPTMVFNVECRVENDPQGAERRVWMA